MYKTRRLHASLLGIGAMVAITIGGWSAPAIGQTEIATIFPGDPAANDNFGQSAGASGDTAVVGAHLKNAAYIFHFDGFDWLQQAKLTPSDGAAGDWFGFSSAVSGDVAVIGAPNHSHGGIASGAAYVFRRSGVVWTQEAELLALGRASGDRFGDSVAIDGDRIVVGATQLGVGTGTAYVFDHSGGVWTQSAQFSPVGLGSGDQFGFSVDVSGDSVIVGARNDDGPADATTNSGAAYVFNLDGGIWSLQATLRASDEAASDQFGNSVSISGDTAAIGAPGKNGATGATYIFDRSGSSWSESQQLVSLFAFFGDQEGWAVSLEGNVLASGMNTYGGSYGAVAIYQRSGGTWTEDDFSPVFAFTTSFTDLGDELGTSVAVTGSIVFAGAPGHDTNGSNSGSVVIFEAAAVGPDVDSDGDGLTDAEELALQVLNGTSCPDPLNPDSDGDGLSDGFENTFGTDPCNADSDGDGLTDSEELFIYFTNPNVADTDGDGLGDGQEILIGTDPLNPDTDNDDLIDGLEVAFGTNPLNPDTDGDGLTDGQEITLAGGILGCPSPLLFDSDGDGLSDGFEHTAPLLDPCDADSDGDGLADGAEINIHGTDPTEPDTDGDGLNDGEEVAMAAGGSCPDPLNPDSDGDGISDGDEVTFGSGPCALDTDDDGLSDDLELFYGTDPNNPDTDGDGLSDGAEVDAAMGSGCPDPLNPDSDGDGLLDGEEISLGTSPCNPDTDGDSLLDGVDPNPLVPDVTPATLVAMTLATAGTVLDTPTTQFLGPNNIVRETRRATMTAKLVLAAVAIHRGQYNAARALLQTVKVQVDGISPPPDWMSAGPAKTTIHSDVQTLLILIDLID